MRVKDRLIVGLILSFTAVALTHELYWLVFHQEMEQRTDLMARLAKIYWPIDYTYRIAGYPIEKAFTLAIEGVNTFLTPILSALLIWAIFKRRSYRYPLQLLIAVYTTYSTFLYFAVAHISGYAVFESKTVGTFLMFYGLSMPWLLAYAWMAWDAYRALVHGERA